MNGRDESGVGVVPKPSGPLRAPAPVYDHPPAPPPSPNPTANFAPPQKTLPIAPETPPLPDLRRGDTIDTLLKRTGHDEKFVNYGSLRVDVRIAAEFEKAERYLAKDPDAVKLLRQLVHDDVEHRIHQIDSSDGGGDRFEPNRWLLRMEPGGDIFWNPTAGTRNAAGIDSPALALLHEQGHAWEALSDPSRYLAGRSDKGERWTDDEERRNEQTTEAHAARLLGEPVRSDHWGDAVPVAGPTSRNVLMPPIAHTNASLISAINGSIDDYKRMEYVTPEPATSVTSWDHKQQRGMFVPVDGRTVALDAGNGKFQIFDVKRDLNGRYPRQYAEVSVDAHGHVRDSPVAAQNVPLHVFEGGKIDSVGPGFRKSGTIVDLDSKRVVLASRDAHGKETLATFRRDELEEHLTGDVRLDKSLVHKNVDLSIGPDGKAHIEVVPPRQRTVLEHVRTPAIARPQGRGHEM